MKTEAWVFAPVAAFFLITTPIYGFMAKEPIGVVALGLSGALCAMIAFYLLLTGRKMGPRPEDLADAEIADGAGEVGFFPPTSIWPFWCTVAVAIIVLGPVFGWWLTLFGAGVGIWAVGGWCFQYYVGEYSH